MMKQYLAFTVITDLCHGFEEVPQCYRQILLQDLKLSGWMYKLYLAHPKWKRLLLHFCQTQSDPTRPTRIWFCNQVSQIRISPFAIHGNPDVLFVFNLKAVSITRKE
ncbi:unnamed protein product [Victoria cruziana]